MRHDAPIRLTPSFVLGKIAAEIRRWPRNLRNRLGYAYWRISPPRAGDRAHGLPAPLIVSLTSYPPRFGVLPLTLKTLLSQSVRPDRLVLWIAHADADRLTPAILSLRRHGLEIRFCEDLRSYKKLVPALEAFPGSYIVTADDDTCYPRDWLEHLVGGAGAPDEVVCLRAHRIRLGADGRPLPYREWRKAGLGERSELVFPTGVGGVLYPPSLFRDTAVTDRRFMEICPDADDIWFYWMARMSGAVARRIKVDATVRPWPRRMSGRPLQWANVKGGGNDRNVARMIAAFGFPPAAPSAPDAADTPAAPVAQIVWS